MLAVNVTGYTWYSLDIINIDRCISFMSIVSTNGDDRLKWV